MAGLFTILRRLYLTAYNWTVFVGCLLITIVAPFSCNCYKWLVRSPVSATLPQISSRLYLTWGILWSFPETQSHVLVSSLLISWSITEASLS
ncbi:hypothetical protein Lal_00007773 [Lupinus albus]|nr:hypothetical protein Lal_00007773 [Lupinus albus]